MSRVAPMNGADNLPPAARRPPPDDDPAPATSSPPAAEPGRDLATSEKSEVSDSASKLASMLAGSDNRDTPADRPSDSEHGPSVPLAALTTPPPVDPDLDLVALGVRVPRYVSEAVRTLAFLRRRKQQDLIVEALRAHLPPELVDECRRTAGRR